MPSEMVERVALALDKAKDIWDRSPTLDSGFAVANDGLDLYRYLARAAIAATRVPTEAMVNRGAAECGVLGAEDSAFDTAKWCWQAMNDAALNEKANPTDG